MLDEIQKNYGVSCSISSVRVQVLEKIGTEELKGRLYHFFMDITMLDEIKDYRISCSS